MQDMSRHPGPYVRVCLKADPPTQTHTHACTHARTHARTHAHTHTRTHNCVHTFIHKNKHAYMYKEILKYFSCITLGNKILK